MILVAMKSSQIKAVGYDPAAQILLIEFHCKTGRSIYRYADVPAGIAAGVIFAESVGKAFGQSIKPWPKLYPFTRLAGDEVEEQTIEDASDAAWLAEIVHLRPIRMEGALS